MRYRTRSDGAQFSSDVAAFVSLLGQAEYLQLLLKLGTGLNHKGYVTETDDLRFSLELQLLNLEFLRIQTNGVFAGMPRHLHEAAEFVVGVGQTIPHLSERARWELRSKLLGGLKTNGLRPIQHEFRIAATVSHFGYDVTFADLEGGQGGFDFLAKRGGKAFEIEGKCISAFYGQAILPQDAEKLFLALAQKFTGWTDDASIPILDITLRGRLDVNQSAISTLIDACNSAAQSRATSVVTDYATVSFLGAAPEAACDRLSDIVQIDRMSTWTNVFLSLTKPRVAVRLQSVRPSRFAPNVLATLSDTAKRQLSGSRPGVIWLHIDYLDPAVFDSLSVAEDGPSFLDLLALAFLDSPTRPHISQLIFSGGPRITRRGEYAISQFKHAVYNAPCCEFGSVRLFPGGGNMKTSGTLTGAKAKSLLSKAKLNFAVPSGPKETSTAATFAFVERLSTSSKPADRLIASAALLVRALNLGEQGRSAQAVEVYDRLLAALADSNETIFDEAIAVALFNRGNMLGELGKHNEALSSYAAVVGRFGASDVPLIAEKVAIALYNSAKLLERDPTRTKEAIGAYQQIGRRFQVSRGIYPQAIVAEAYVNMGVLLGNSEDAVNVYDVVIDRYRASSRADFREPVKKALLNKGRVLMAMDRTAEALDAFNAVLAHPGTSKARAELWAIFWKMDVLSSLGREHEVPGLCDKLVESIDPTMGLELREAGARSLLTKASILRARGDRIGEVAAYDALLSRFGLDPDRELVTLVIASQEGKVEALTSLDRYAEALLACDEIVVLCDGRSGPLKSPEHVAWALSIKAFALAREERLEDAARVCSEIIGRFGPGSPTPLLDTAAKALAERAAHSCDLGRYEEALSDCDTFLATYETSTESWIAGAIALALLTKGVSLLQTERRSDAIDVLGTIVARFGGEAEPPISACVASAQDLLRGGESK